jgi:uncharacterized membrane protein YheB (UPF0754 family)
MDWRLVTFPLVGAFIGAVTNHLAIMMLFRPYARVRVGRWKVPFTPGVIPAQRGTIARNIAETFESQLFSGGEIHAFLTGPKAKDLVESKVNEMIGGLGPIGLMARGLQPKIVDKILVAIDDLAQSAVAEGAEFDIGRRIEDRINAMDIRQVEELVLGFSRDQFRYITLFGGILGAAIGFVQYGLALLGD